MVGQDPWVSISEITGTAPVTQGITMLSDTADTSKTSLTRSVLPAQAGYVASAVSKGVW
jgi:hypothetical protein